MSVPLPIYEATGPAGPGAVSVNGAAVQGAAATSAALAALAAVSATSPTHQIRHFVDELAYIIGSPVTVHQRETLESALATAVLSMVGQLSRSDALPGRVG